MSFLTKSLIFITLFIIIGCAGLPPAEGQPALQGQLPANSRDVLSANASQQNLNGGAAQADAPAGVAANASTGCPAERFLDVQAHPANGAYPAPQLNVTCTESTFIVQSNGIPNFEFVQITPNNLQAQNHRWEIPLTPQAATQPGDIPLLGPVAVAVNGLPIFGPNEAPRDDYGDPYLDGLLDYCNGHTAPGGMYHFHARPDCIIANIEGKAGLVIGYAFDGYPILSPYLCEDASCASVKKMQSSWQRTQDVRNAWQAHQYVTGSGDLDQCNGLTFADGSYAYFATDTFPYFLGCYHGVANNTGRPPGRP